MNNGPNVFFSNNVYQSILKLVEVKRHVNNGCPKKNFFAQNMEMATKNNLIGYIALLSD